MRHHTRAHACCSSPVRSNGDSGERDRAHDDRFEIPEEIGDRRPGVDERGADDTLQSHALTVYLRPVQRTAAAICC